MPTTPNKVAVNRILPEVGTHIARVIGFIYIGTIEDEYLGVKKKLQKIRLTFELPEELHVWKEGEAPKPIVLSQEYTLSMGTKSNLRPIIEGIIGRPLKEEEEYSFDAESLVNMPCLVSVKRGFTKKGSEFANVASTSPLMKGQVCKDAFNPLRVLNYAEKWDETYFNTLPSFIKDKMVTSDEYKKLKGVESDIINVSDIPF